MYIMEKVLLAASNMVHVHGMMGALFRELVLTRYFHCRVVYEGQALECVLDGCTTEEDVVHAFRVAAMNKVGRGPYCMPVTFTQRKACEFKVHAWTGRVYWCRSTLSLR